MPVERCPPQPRIRSGSRPDDELRVELRERPERRGHDVADPEPGEQLADERGLAGRVRRLEDTSKYARAPSHAGGTRSTAAAALPASILAISASAAPGSPSSVPEQARRHAARPRASAARPRPPTSPSDSSRSSTRVDSADEHDVGAERVQPLHAARPRTRRASGSAAHRRSGQSENRSVADQALAGAERAERLGQRRQEGDDPLGRRVEDDAHAAVVGHAHGLGRERGERHDRRGARHGERQCVRARAPSAHDPATDDRMPISNRALHPARLPRPSPVVRPGTPDVPRARGERA